MRIIKQLKIYFLFLKYNFFIFYKMEINKAKNQSVEGIKIYKTRKYVQSDTAKQNAEKRRLRNQYLIDHKEEILKLEPRGRVKKVAELLKQDLNLNVNYKTLGNLIQKYVISGISNQKAEVREKRNQYLIDHKEEILKYDSKDRVKKVAELLKQDLNLDSNLKTLSNLIHKYVITDITNQKRDERKLRDKYLLEHKEEIKKLEHNGRIKKVQEMLKKDLNLDVNYNKMYVAFNKYNLL